MRLFMIFTTHKNGYNARGYKSRGFCFLLSKDESYYIGEVEDINDYAFALSAGTVGVIVGSSDEDRYGKVTPHLLDDYVFAWSSIISFGVVEKGSYHYKSVFKFYSIAS